MLQSLWIMQIYANFTSANCKNLKSQGQFGEGLNMFEWRHIPDMLDHFLKLGSKTLLSSGESAASLSQPLSRKVRRQHPVVSKIRPVPSRSTVLMDGMQAGRGGRGCRPWCFYLSKAHKSSKVVKSQLQWHAKRDLNSHIIYLYLIYIYMYKYITPIALPYDLKHQHHIFSYHSNIPYNMQLHFATLGRGSTPNRWRKRSEPNCSLVNQTHIASTWQQPVDTHWWKEALSLSKMILIRLLLSNV